ncbi:transglycosylase SLT domain-containing protein [Campylobacterota bacterium DY0563]
MKKTLLSLFLAHFLCANDVTQPSSLQEIATNELPTNELSFNYISNMKKGLTRDFYINEYLKTDISSNEAFGVLSLIDNMNNKLFFNFSDKFNHDETRAVAQCMKMDYKLLVDSYSDCIVNGLTLEKASKLNSLELNTVIKKAEDKYPLFAKKIKVLASPIPFTKLIVQNENLFYDIFLGVDTKFRENYFNYKIPKRTLKKIDNNTKFKELIKISLTNPNLNFLQTTFKGFEDTDKLDNESLFYFAFNSIVLKDYNKAYEYLLKARAKTENKFFIDKIDFWIYLITKDKNILKNLSISEDFNFYSYYSNELLKNEIDFSTLDIIKIDEFDKLKSKYSLERIALLYAFAKVESNFDENKISKQYDVGIFQLNPDLIKKITLQNNLSYDINSFFTLENNIDYMNIYLDSLNLDKDKIFKSFLTYNNMNEQLAKIKSYNLSHPLSSYLNFELLDIKNKESFILWYVLYYNKLSDEKKKVTINTILETL